MYLIYDSRVRIIAAAVAVILLFWAASKIQSSLAKAITDAMTPRQERLHEVMGR